ncbi:2-oxoacid:acceptor oxidoreductase family protein [Desulfobacula sp.]|uniref:2-oxoacid:acceptor oxidoreductase family protein n=1 Tax=Desulfobacula sp. TaxID=2593537 RepID=UPI0026177D2A|nr:2-oxoacid:acceptor oxidoreductase family protein [Desulfobacula sp.]
MKSYNIHITGVGGQGIGLLSQAVLRGIDHAGINVIAVDTHGLAQRGGVVVSMIRCGEKIHSPMIMKHSADLVLGLEIHEALRGLEVALKTGGTLVYLDVSWQPLPVRLGLNTEITAREIQTACEIADATEIKVNTRFLEDSRMQNMALLGSLAKQRLIPGVTKEHYDMALEDLLTGEMLKKNRAIFEGYAS